MRTATAKTRGVTAAIPQNYDLKTLWDFFLEDNNFFKEVEFDDESGFDELHELMTFSRYVSSVVVLLMLCANLTAVFFKNAWRIIMALFYDQGIEGRRPYTLMGHFCKQYLGITLEAQNLVGFVELVMGFGIMSWMLQLAWKAKSEAKESPNRWAAVTKLFFTVVPTASSISAVALLNNVTPAVASAKARALMQQIQKEGYNRRNGSAVFWFLVGAAFSGFIGLDAFLVKFQMLAFAMHGQKGPSFILVFNAMVFLNQILGAVRVASFTKGRLYVFIFGGEDGIMTNQEQLDSRVWESMLAKDLWDYQGLAWHQVLAIYLTFGDRDIQKLALDDVDYSDRIVRYHLYKE